MYTLIELLNELKLETLKGDDQERINILAVEIANRIYVPNNHQKYDDLLNQLGYKQTKNLTKNKTK